MILTAVIVVVVVVCPSDFIGYYFTYIPGIEALPYHQHRELTANAAAMPLASPRFVEDF